jgi:NADH-quinone oxidoreductase subunit A
MTGFVGYLLIFLFIAVFFVFIHLMIGKLLRPARPDPEKLTIYECGEPTIGSAWIQFDLRFYVVALLFVIFDVEVVFFFPWAVVFGKATDLATNEKSPTMEARRVLTDALVPRAQQVSRISSHRFVITGHDLAVLEHSGVPSSVVGELAALRDTEFTTEDAFVAGLRQHLRLQDVRRYLDLILNQARDTTITIAGANKLAWIAFWDIMVFFGVLLVGFAYLWKRGDLDWVRSTLAEQTATAAAPAEMPAQQPRELVTAG